MEPEEAAGSHPFWNIMTPAAFHSGRIVYRELEGAHMLDGAGVTQDKLRHQG